MKKTNKNLTSLAEHLEKQYGKRGTKKREEYEEGFEAFKLGVMLQELRKHQGMTQEQLADKCGTTKTIFHALKTMQATFDFQHS